MVTDLDNHLLSEMIRNFSSVGTTDAPRKKNLVPLGENSKMISLTTGVNFAFSDMKNEAMIQARIQTRKGMSLDTFLARA